MNELTQRRLAVAEAKFDAYQFDWEVEEYHHWHTQDDSDIFCRTVLFCGEAPGAPCMKGIFVVRFQPRREVIDECYAMIDGCLIGNDPALEEFLRKAS